MDCKYISLQNPTQYILGNIKTRILSPNSKLSSFLEAISRFPFQACLSCCFFLRQKKSFLWSLFLAKKKYNNPSQGFPFQSGLGEQRSESSFQSQFSVSEASCLNFLVANNQLLRSNPFLCFPCLL